MKRVFCGGWKMEGRSVKTLSIRNRRATGCVVDNKSSWRSGASRPVRHRRARALPLSMHRFQVRPSKVASNWCLQVGDELADAAFHLQLDQSVHFDGVFHRQLFNERFDETVDDHRAGF